MANMYCPECGKKHFFTLKRPEKCESCGISFVSAKFQAKTQVQQKSKSSIVKKEQEIKIEYDDDSSDVIAVPKIQSLAYELDYGDMSNILKGKDLIGEIKEKPESKSSKTKWKRKATKNTKNK
jgi:hypothetical protein